MYNDVTVTVTVKVGDEKIARTKVKRHKVASLEDGLGLVRDTHVAVDGLARDLRRRVGV